MPFKIVRNDITKMTTEAIVNTANCMPAVGHGCDTAVYKAAGYEELLSWRRKYVGSAKVGEAFITPGFRLPAKYIIHTVSPLFIDGNHGEEELLRSCYRRSLALAAGYGIRSIAFPLIATGSFGYPKEEGMRIAVDEIHAFLLRSDMEIFLVVFDENATRMGRSLYPDLEAYIDRNYVQERRAEEYGTSDHLRADRREARPQGYSGIDASGESAGLQADHFGYAARESVPSQANYAPRESAPGHENYAAREPASTQANYAAPTDSREKRRKPGLFGSLKASKRRDTWEQNAIPELRRPEPEDLEEAYFGTSNPKEAVHEEANLEEAKPKEAILADEPFAAEDDTILELERRLAERMEHMSDTFPEYLMYLIRKNGLDNADVYKRAIVDKKVFSKIKNNPDYHPKKMTALCLCIGAKLNIDESRDLLARAGYALSPCDKTDIIFSYFIENGIYDMIELDIQLEEHGLPCIIS